MSPFIITLAPFHWNCITCNFQFVEIVPNFYNHCIPKITLEFPNSNGKKSSWISMASRHTLTSLHSPLPITFLPIPNMTLNSSVSKTSNPNFSTPTLNSSVSKTSQSLGYFYCSSQGHCFWIVNPYYGIEGYADWSNW